VCTPSRVSLFVGVSGASGGSPKCEERSLGPYEKIVNRLLKLFGHATQHPDARHGAALLILRNHLWGLPDLLPELILREFVLQP
jgi:hypothetical protein